MKRCPSCRRVYDRDSEVCQVDGTNLDAFNLDPLIGQTVAKRYRVVRRLGAGSLGTVYLAQELSTGNNVALKILAKELQCDDEALKQYRWDARFATASQPSNIVRVYEVDRTDEGQVFVAMEYLEGENLADVIRREGALELGRALRLAGQMAQGLVAASKAGVPHRDLKPQNVLVVGPDERVKLTDFGVARLWRTTMGGTRPRLDSVALEYRAPEQLNGGDADDRTDVYGLGAVLYAMLTGAAPQTGLSRGTDGSDGVWQAPLPIRELRPEVPVALEHALLRAMEREPERRQSGMHEFAEGLLDLAAAVIERRTREAAPSPVRERVLEPAVQAPRAAAVVVAEPVRERSFLESGYTYLERWRASRERWRAQRQASRESWRARRGQWQAQWQAYRAQFQSYRERQRAAWQAYRTQRQSHRESSRIDAYVVRGWSRLERARSSLERSTGRLTALASRSLGDGLRWGSVKSGRLALAGVAALVVVGAMAWAALDWRTEVSSPVRVTAGRDSESVGEPGAIETASQILAAAPSRRVGSGLSGAVDLAPSPASPAREDRKDPARVQAERSQPGASSQRPIVPAAELEPATRQQSPRPSVRPETEIDAGQVRPDASPRRPAEPASRPVPLSTQQIARIQTEAEQKLQHRGLLRVSATDRWGVTLETAPTGEVILAGVLRDMALYADAVRLVREVPGVRDVRGNVEVSEVGAVSIVQSDSARIQAEIQQRLRSRGLLRESAADRWGVTVEVSPEGDVTLVGAVRDAEMHREAVRRAQEVAKVRLVKQDIRVMDRGNGQ